MTRTTVQDLCRRLHEAQSEATHRVRDATVSGHMDQTTPGGIPMRTPLRLWGWHFWTHHRDLVRILGMIEDDTEYDSVTHFMRQAQEEFGKFLGEVSCLSDEDLDRRPPEGGPTIRQIVEHVIEELTGSIPRDVEAASRPG